MGSIFFSIKSINLFIDSIWTSVVKLMLTVHKSFSSLVWLTGCFFGTGRMSSSLMPSIFHNIFALLCQVSCILSWSEFSYHSNRTSMAAIIHRFFITPAIIVDHAFRIISLSISKVPWDVVVDWLVFFWIRVLIAHYIGIM